MDLCFETVPDSWVATFPHPPLLLSGVRPDASTDHQLNQSTMLSQQTFSEISGFALLPLAKAYHTQVSFVLSCPLGYAT